MESLELETLKIKYEKLKLENEKYKYEVDDLNTMFEELKKENKIMRDALEEHSKFAEECRLDWSDYDGRTHLYVVAGINQRALAKVSK